MHVFCYVHKITLKLTRFLLANGLSALREGEQQSIYFMTLPQLEVRLRRIGVKRIVAGYEISSTTCAVPITLVVAFSLVPSLCAPPDEKRSSGQSRISWVLIIPQKW